MHLSCYIGYTNVFVRHVSAGACLVPYIAVYMKMLGLTLTETALICGAMPFVIGFTLTMVGGLADKLNAHKAMFIILSLLAAVFYGSMLFAPRRTTSVRTPEIRSGMVDIQVHCGKNGVHVIACGGRSLAVGSANAGDFHRSFSAKNLSLNTDVCRWTCNAGTHQNTAAQAQTTSFTRLNRTGYMILNRTASLAFSVNIMHKTTMDKCGNLASPVTEIDNCRCYNIVDPREGMVCEKVTRLICTTDCRLVLHNASHEIFPADRKGLHFGPVFWTVAIAYFFGEMSMQPLFGLADAMTFTFLGDERDKWGKQRLFGSFGIAIFGPISGILMDNYSLGLNKYAFAFILHAIFMVMTAVCVYQYNVRDRRVSTRPPPARLLSDIAELVTKPEAFVLLSLVLIFGVYFGVITSFLFWYLKLIGDAPQALLGLCIMCNCSVEAFVMFYSDRIFRIVSQHNCFAIVCLGYAVRLVSYSFISNPWMVLVIEPLHAITFGLMYASASTYACKITPPGAHGSIQNIVSALHFCFGKYPANTMHYKWRKYNR